MTAISQWLALINLLLVVGGTAGGIIAFRAAIAKAESDVQTRVREALLTENNLLKSRIDRLENTNKRMEKILDLIATTLKRTHSIELSIDEDIVILRDIKSGNNHTVSINQQN